MTIQEVKEILSPYGNKAVKVTITTNAHNKKYKQSLRINANNDICIGAYNSPFPNYRVSENVTEKWKCIRIAKQ